MIMDSHEAKPFYRGRFDDHKLKVPNGAIVNRAYLDFIAAGAYGEAKTVQVREGNA